MAERLRRGRPVALAVCCAALAAACSLPGDGDGADKPADGPRTTAVFTPREPVNAARLRQIAALMRQRAEGFGFQDVAVEADAGRVTVSLRGGSARELASLGKPAVLVFRPVVLLEPAGGASPVRSPDPGSGSGSEPGSAEFAALDCSVPAQRVDHQKGDGRRAVACAERAETGAWTKYLLEPVALSGTEISDAQARLDAQIGSGWQIRLTFTTGGARKFADVTARLAAQLSPANQFAMVLDGAVLSAPLVSSPIPGGTAVITGNYTQDSAARLAAQLSSGNLPTAMDLTSVTR
ncbi:SecDF P1 head subdomain-containing protein [Streptomyces sp. NPDC001070]